MKFSFVSAGKHICGEGAPEDYFETSILTNHLFNEYRNQVLDGLAKGQTVKKDFSFEHKISKMAGFPVWLQTSVRLSYSELQECYELRGLSVCITKLKEAQAEAQKAISVRDEFLSIASHELKTPLTPLKLQLDLLQRHLGDKTKSEEVLKLLPQFMEKSRNQLNRLLKLIDELLDISKMNTRKCSLEKEMVDVSQLIHEVCERFASEAARLGIDIRLSLKNGVLGKWDRFKIEQAVTNLMTNALKYGNGKPVEISTNVDKDIVEICFKDHGIGIKKEDQSRVFGLYERAVSPMNYGGLGLGLYIVRQIAKIHGGTVSLTSEPNVGTSVVLRLPSNIQEPAHARTINNVDGTVKSPVSRVV